MTPKLVEMDDAIADVVGTLVKSHVTICLPQQQYHHPNSI
jgi:hypothetical protein